jgi:hypothetical protein
MKNKRIIGFSLCALAAIALLNPLSAQTKTKAPNASSSASASEIMMKVYARSQPADMSALLTMTLIDSKGHERVRSIKQISASFGTLEKKIMQFQGPADVRGTSFMSWSYAEAGKGDDQWIYLPALKRVKRISSDGRGDSFMGSDFSYDDLAERHPNEDTHKIIGSEAIAGEECWIIESSPRDKNYSYSRVVSWVSKNKQLGFRRDFYDKGGALLKTLTILKMEDIGGFLMITQTEMRNVQKNHRTSMVFTSVEVNKGMQESVFTERSMMKAL